MNRRNGTMTGLSSLIGGFNQGYRMVKDIEDDQADRDFKREQRARQQRQWGDEDALRASMKDAAAPATVEQSMVKAPEQDDRDVGQPGEAAPTPAGFSVRGKAYATMAEAQGAADTYNASAQVTARMSDALTRAGKVSDAAQLRSSARQEQVASLQLDDLQRAHANKMFDESLGGLGDFESIGSFTKTKAVPSADGKSITFHQVGADGNSKALPYQFSNDAKGLSEAKALLSKSLPEMQKLGFLHQQSQAAESKARWEREQQLREDSEKRRATHEDRMLAATLAKNAPAVPVVPAFDEKGARELAQDAIKAENKRRAETSPPQPLMTGAETARMLDDYVGAQRATFNNKLVLEAASNDLRRVAPNSPEYAQAYSRAVSMGEPKAMQAQLEAMGFKAPGQPSSAAPAPAAPTQQQVAARPPASVTSTAAPPAASNSSDPLEGQALDAARVTRSNAQAALQRYGSIQRSKDPQGYQAARAAYEQAVADEKAAEQAWASVAPRASMTAAMRTR